MKISYSKSQNQQGSLKLIDRRKKFVRRIQDVVLTKTLGETHYVALSFAGALALVDPFFAMPWKGMFFDTMKNSFVLEVDKEQWVDVNKIESSVIPEQVSWLDSAVKVYEDCQEES